MKYLFYIITILAFSSCDNMMKTVDIEITDIGRMITVNSLLQEGDTIKARIFRSAYIFDKKEIKVLTNANVQFYENNILLGTATLNNNNEYVLNQLAKAGKTYKIKVESDDLATAEATSSFTQKASIISTDTLRGIDSDANKVKQCKISFKDPANEENYYLIQLPSQYNYYDDYYKEEMKEQDISIISQSDYLFSSDLSTVQGTWNGMLVTDNLFDGQTKELIFDFERIYDDDEYYEDENTVDSLSYRKVVLYSINKDLFNYLASYAKYEDNKDFSFFSEPVQVYNNIKDGLGIFATCSASIDSFPVMTKEGRNIINNP